MASSKIIGIDLGTTNSCVAIMEGGRPIVISNTEGKPTTPSIVSYDSEIKVGDPAKRQLITKPKSTISTVKRLMGRRFDEETVQQEINSVSYDIIPGPNGDAWVKVLDQKLSPPQISSEILRALKTSAEKYLGEKVEKAVITVPAYFNDPQRQATKDAGRIAGLEVMRLVNEPTAAALAYGLDKTKGDSIIAVFDLGGGTFDITIIETATVDEEKQFQVRSTAGDTFLGGEDFDRRIVSYLIEEFKKDQGVDLSKDLLAMQRLKDAAEKAKIELSTAKETEINLPYITGGSEGAKHLCIKLTRAKLEALVDDLIKRTIKPCQKAIEDAKLSAKDINQVILVGGQTRMPKVAEEVEAFFHLKPKTNVNPDEVVAMGAAVQAGVLGGDVKDVLLLDVTPLSLGIETLGRIMTKIIPRNTTIPVAKTQTFSTAEDNQRAVTIHVLQGEREAVDHNKSLGRFDLTDIPPAPRGNPQIDVTFDIDANGIIHVSAKEKSTGKEQKIRIEAGSGLSEEQIEQMVKDAEINKQKDQELHELVQVRNQADALVYEVEKLQKDEGSKMTSEEKIQLENALNNLKESAKNDKKEDILAKHKDLIDISSKIRSKLQEQTSQTNANTGPNREASSSSTQKKDSNVNEEIQDAEFEEVKNGEKKDNKEKE